MLKKSLVNIFCKNGLRNLKEYKILSRFLDEPFFEREYVYKCIKNIILKYKPDNVTKALKYADFQSIENALEKAMIVYRKNAKKYEINHLPLHLYDKDWLAKYLQQVCLLRLPKKDENHHVNKFSVLIAVNQYMKHSAYFHKKIKQYEQNVLFCLIECISNEYPYCDNYEKKIKCLNGKGLDAYFTTVGSYSNKMRNYIALIAEAMGIPREKILKALELKTLWREKIIDGDFNARYPWDEYQKILRMKCSSTLFEKALWKVSDFYDNFKIIEDLNYYNYYSRVNASDFQKISGLKEVQKIIKTTQVERQNILKKITTAETWFNNLLISKKEMTDDLETNSTLERN